MTEQTVPRPGFFGRLGKCARDAMRPSFKAAVLILGITIPISLAVKLMQEAGILPHIAAVFAPAFKLIGLPGESALVFISAAMLNVYTAIAVIKTLELNLRAITILALMCLISHNLFVETAVQKRTGSGLWRMLIVRLSSSFAAGCLLNLLLPADMGAQTFAAVAQARETFWTAMAGWGRDMGYLTVKILVLIVLLMILQRILAEFGVTRFLARLLKYPLIALGLPPDTVFLWIVANTLGLAYGAGVLIDEVESGKISREHADALNHHIGVCHSLLEDSFLFAAIGVPVVWITVPRVIIAAVVVWLRRLAMRGRHANPA
jgi:spore maturation protein SpmB